MGKISAILLLLFAGFLLPRGCFADIPGDLSIKLDGKLDDPLWEKAKRYEPFRFSGQDEPAPVQTTGFFAYDNSYFYFGFICQEPEIPKIKQNAKVNRLIPIYGDDSVEIMIDSNRDGTDGFYRIAVNSLGYAGAFFYWRYGSFMPVDMVCFARGNIEKDRWTVEIAVPISSLARNGGLSKDIGINFGRNRVAGEKREETYSAAKGNFFYPGTFHVCSIDGIDREPYLLEIQPANRGIVPKVTGPVQNGGRLEGVVPFIFRNAGSKSKNLKILTVVRNSKNDIISGENVETTLMLPPGKAKQINLPISIPKAGEYTFSIKTVENGLLTANIIYPLFVKFEIISLKIISPFYRNNIYATEKIREIKARVNIGLPAEKVKDTQIVFSLQDNQKKTLATKRFDIKKIDQALSLSIPELETGQYLFKVSLKKGKVIMAETEETINKLAPAKGSEVRIDEKLRLLVNGKPFFPIVEWSGGLSLETVKNSGMNAVVYPAVSSWLDKAKDQGLFVVSLFGAPYRKYINVDYAPPMPEDVRKIFTNAVNQVKDHPAFLLYYLVDEPGLFSVNPVFIKEAYDLVRSLDPYHPMLICEAVPSAMYSFDDACDIFAIDPNPLPMKDNGLCKPMTSVSDFIEEIKKTGEGKIMPGFTCQVFSYGDMGVPTLRIQSFVEQRCMNYLSIMAGSRMLQYAVFGNSWNKYPSVRIGLPYLSKELDALSRIILLGKDVSGISSSDPAIRLLAKEKDGQMYIIAVNMTGKPVESTFKIPERITKLKVISESREVGIEKGGFSDKFIPFGTHIYTTDFSFPDLKTLEEIKKEITEAKGFYEME